MNRREKLLSGLQLDGLLGLEIGALASPVLRRADGEVIYVDHVDTATLRKKYGGNPDIDVDGIVEVDAVWGRQTMQEALGPGRSVDFVLASHVVEHVPDLVGWLKELASVLRPGGTIRLAAPDKRFCFDYLRAETQITDVLVAHFHEARAPQVRQIIDNEIHHRMVDTGEAWAGRVIPTIRIEPSRLQHAFGLARWAGSGEYIDVHCWSFTPLAFATIMEQLASLGLTNLACERWFDTEVNELEFFLVMKVAEPAAVMDSWAAMRRDLLGKQDSMRPLEPAADAADLESALKAARDEVAALRNSTSWKMTMPLRQVVERFRRP